MITVARLLDHYNQVISKLFNQPLNRSDCVDDLEG